MTDDTKYYALNEGENIDYKEETSFRFMMSIFSSIISKGSKNVITQDDVDDIPLYLEPSNSIFSKFKIAWDNEKENSNHPSLFSVSYHIVKKKFWISFLWAAIYELLIFSNPILLPYLLSYTVENTNEHWIGITIFAVILVTNSLAPITQGYCAQYSIMTSREISVGIFCLLYEKILNSPKGTFSGDILPYFFTESNSIFESMTIYQYCLMSFPKVIIGIIFLGIFIEWYCLIVVLFIILEFIIILYLAGKFKEILLEKAKVTNKRASLEYEVIKQLEFIKLYMWENHFFNKVGSAKDTELWTVFKESRYFFAIYFMGIHFPLFGAFLTFLFYGLFEGFSPVPFLTAVAVITYLSTACRFLVLPIFFFFSWQACSTMVEEWLLDSKKLPVKLPLSEPGNIIINNATMAWDNKPILSDISLKIGKGEFVTVIGSFGSGKSTLASAILNEVPLLSGTVEIGGTYSYVPSQSWIPQGTIRYNILMGKEYDEKWYIKVLKAADLLDDLQALPDGDMTLVSSGTTLSGGQQQRISIARALYSNRDIYVLDDVLSALDNNVARNVFYGGIVELLQKRNKTVVMILSQIEYLQYSDRVLVISDGKIFRSGPYSQLILDDDFAQFMRKHYPDFDGDGDIRRDDVIEKTVKTIEDKKIDIFQQFEKIDSDVLSWNVFKEYIIGGGVFTYGLSILLSGLYILGTTGGYWWILLVWMPRYGNYSVAFYSGVYAFINIFLIGLAISNLYLHIYHSTITKKYFHDKIFKNALKSPISYFEKNGVGKILSSLQSDLNSIVLEVPDALWSIQHWGLCIICTGIAAAVGAPVVFGIVLIIVLIYIPWHRSTMNAIVRLQKIAAVSRPPLYNFYKDTLDGVSSIRVYNLSDTMFQTTFNLINLTFRNISIAWGGVLWYTVRAHILGTMILLCSFAWILLNINFNWIPINKNSEAYAFVLAGSIVYYVTTYAYNASRLTAKMVHAERATKYFDLETEQINFDRSQCDKNWIKSGTISFENVTMSYQGHIEKRLDNVSFFVENGQRIGVLGRTGAGKSSLFKAILRFHEITSGTIKISDIDISTLRLEDLRISITIIPQSPTIFTDTLRNNLDPFGEYPDERLFQVLKQVYLDKWFQGLSHGLDSEISDMNMALGEKQLLCFARAILKQSKIVIMDEATASLDVETELLIHKLMKENFENSTVLWIAHHLTTVMEFDKVLLMDQGKVIEFDTPYELIKNEKGMFSQLVSNTGEKTSQFLKELALKREKK